MTSEFPDEMRVAIGTYKPATDDFLRFAAQLGVDDILLTPHRHPGFESALPLGEAWSEDALAELKSRANGADLRLYAVEKMPVPLYEILLTDDADERAELTGIITETITNMGAAGVPVLGYSGHPPDGAVRTTREHPVRGGALASAYDVDDLHELDRDDDVERDVSEDLMWERYEAFLHEVVPIAEDAGVTLGVHPSDPPVERLFGIPLLFRNRENFERALDIHPSDNHGLKLGMGCWSEMGEDLVDVVEHFGGDQIVYAHFRDVVGTVPRFHETFVDDPAGNFDEYEVVEALDRVGFGGVMTPDHVPLMEGESDWEFGSTLGRSYTVGYLKGMLKSLE
ncbi:mannonate dehydratase [Salarchaeum sp. JOR-1]|uniref:mannonate dehydratase n=1 Tax=Salarchaeum sp. JOR-1 TaxID=2599399 RepID=UPI001198C923|nr:mannonate dehydratase [Salarchaeum sp. JOR-1]QDX39890.1 TIM barrel protein [Salarchaeum sp. JOR-1]